MQGKVSERLREALRGFTLRSKCIKVSQSKPWYTRDALPLAGHVQSSCRVGIDIYLLKSRDPPIRSHPETAFQMGMPGVPGRAMQCMACRRIAAKTMSESVVLTWVSSLIVVMCVLTICKYEKLCMACFELQVCRTLLLTSITCQLVDISPLLLRKG